MGVLIVCNCLNQDLQDHVYNKDIYAGFPAEMTSYRIFRIREVGLQYSLFSPVKGGMFMGMW